MCEWSLFGTLADVSAHGMVRVNGAGGGRRGGVPWMVALLALAAVTSSSLSALSLYRVLALQAEVEGLRSEVNRRREERWGAPGEAQQQRPADDNWTQVSQSISRFDSCKSKRGASF